MKYWTKKRVEGEKTRRENKGREALDSAIREAKEAHLRQKTHTKGDDVKNMALMLDALGSPVRRQMVERLRKGGAMSLSKLSEPFRITLPTALAHIQALERSNLIISYKQGRVRLCLLRPRAFEELARLLVSKTPFV